MASNPNFQKIRKDYIQSILPHVFVPANSPQFNEFSLYISVIVHSIGWPLPQYLQFIDSIIEANPTHPKATQYYRDFVRWLLGNESDPIRKADIVLQELEVIQKIFTQNPTQENSEGLIEALVQPSYDDNFDPSLLLIGKLAMLDLPVTVILVMIQKYVRQCSEENLQKCLAMHEMFADSYHSEKKSKAIKLILERKSADALIVLQSV
ncbi:hypothetical protein GPJ56_000956 [Histomonas meleagridis]|uniref:uncharacterized protein n=1 Tax=Histomonas meleagridis TaxID=135588 RepID=UPI00355AB93F|nr:hypothetical protein GPJ56_000956 [Histomonas meleagridis]KAH0803791.1 hypothetical protein GO595_002621 [Histomonas meleagridis]